MNRRDMLSALLAVTASGALASCGDKNVKAAEGLGATQFAAPGAFLSKSEMAVLSVLADKIIPRTDTPGAIAAGVPDTLQSLASDWADDDMRAGWRTGIAAISERLAAGGKTLINQSSTEQVASVKALDDFAFGAKASGAEAGVQDIYKSLKSTIATAYYMSEPGATEELRYEAVPGEWRGCVPFDEIGRTWAT